jgi:hypothetical protein
MAISRLKMYLGRTERKRKALHMLMLSGVVRPSHIALRFTSLVPQIEEQTEGSQHNALSPTHLSNQLYRFIKSLQKRLTQLLSLEPTRVKHSLFKPRRMATSKMCLRS